MRPPREIAIVCLVACAWLAAVVATHARVPARDLQSVLLVVVALLLSRLVDGGLRRAERAQARFLARVLAYGAGNVANDAWLEQGWSGYALASVLEPAASWLWPAVLATAVVVWLGLVRPIRRGPTASETQPAAGAPPDRPRPA